MNDNNMNKGNDIKNKLAKKAVTSVAGPLAGKAVDKLGPTAFKNSDLINKGSKAPTGASELPKEGLEDGNNGLQEPASKESSRSPLSNLGKRLGLGGASDVTGEVDASARIFSFIRKHWKVSAAVIGGGTLILLLLLAIPIIVASIGGGVIEFFSGIGDAIIGFFSPDEQELIEEYYEELKEVKNDFYTRYGICIDTNLITATLTVDVDAQEYSNEINNEPGEDKATGGEEGESDEVETEKDYKKMKKEVGILASMQIKRTLYGHNKNVKNGTEDCRSEEEGPEEELVSEENLENLEFPDFWDKFIKSVSSEEAKIEKYVSINADLVSKHDLNAFQKFFTKKINEEKNYEYRIYTPAYEKVAHTDSRGNTVYTLECKRDKLPSTDKDGKPSLSIGDLNTMEDAVYYWNLVNSFIPNYYDEFLPSEEGEKRDNAIKKIAEDIYLLYKDLGPGEACPISTPYICRSDDGSEYFNAYTYDPSGKFTTQSGIQFFDNISAVAINEMTKAGINASITMAQAALESGWGGSTLSKQFSNYYGITAGGCTSGLGSPSEHKNEVYQSGEAGNTCTGNAYWNGSVVAMCNSAGNDCQWYRIYDSFENSTRDHTALTTGSSIYAGCNSSSDSLDQITCIKERGYATDPKYVQKVMDLINTYNLTQYDIGNWNGQPLTMPTTPNYTNNMCYSLGGGASGDWASWKQCDSQWGGLNIGSKTICRVGCLLTSVAIQIARSGVPTTLGDSFNPGTFMQAHKANGGFSGNSFYWNVTDVAPNFQLVNHNIAVNNSNAASVVDSYIKQGYYVILNLHHPTEHHVAVNYVDGNKIYMYDPGNFGDEVFSAFRGNLTIDSIAIYKAG